MGMIQPNSMDAENSIIGSLLIDPDLIEKTLQKITSKDFYNTVNISIMAAMETLFEEEKDVDISLVTNYLVAIPEVPGRIAECLEGTSTTSNPQNIIDIVLEKSARRKIIKASHNIIAQSSNQDTQIGDSINAVEKLNEELERYSNDAGIKRRRRGRLIRVNDVAAGVEKYYNEGRELQGLGFSEWPEFSKHYRLVKGLLNVFNGIPSHGKTTIVDAIIINSVLEHGWKWAIFSPENKPYYMHIHPMVQKLVGMNFFGKNRMNKAQLSSAMEKLNDHILFLEPDQENVTHKSLQRLIKDASEHYKIDAALIDPWNKVEVNLKKNENDMKAVGRLLREYQAFGRTNNVWMGICAHPTKMLKERGAAVYPVPTLYNLEGSSHWYNGVDMGITFYRDFAKNLVQCHIQKVKFKTHGKVGLTWMRYNEENSRMFELDYNKDVKKQQPESKPVLPAQTTMWQNRNNNESGERF